MAARTQGRVKSFNAGKGFGFIDIGCGTDVFVHIKDCTDGKQPLTGDVLSFVMEPSASKPGQMVAKSVEGGTGAKEMFPGPQEPAPDVPGTGSHVGKVRTWNDTKGYGFIDLPGQPNVWLHVKECVNTQPQSGDWVRFDVQPSDFKQGQMVAKNVTGGSQPLGSRPAFGPIRTGDGTVDAAAYGPYAAGLAGVAYQAAPVQPATAGYVVQQGVAVQQEIPQHYGYVEGQVGSQVYQQQPDYQQYAVQQPGMQYAMQQPAMQQPAMQPAMQMQPQAMQPQAMQPQGYQGYQQGMQGMQGMQGYGMQGYQQGMQGMQGVQGMQQQGYQQMGMQPQQMQFQQTMQQPMQQLQQPMQQPMQQGFMQQMPQQQMAQPMMQPGPEMQAGMGSMGVGMDPNVQMSLSGVAPPTAMAPMAPMAPTAPMAPVASLELQPAAAPAMAPIPAADPAPAVQVPAAQEAPQEAPQEAAEAPAVAAATPQ